MRFSRREVLSGSMAVAGCALAARARAVEASRITPALVEAAKAEGKLAFYTAMDLPVAEKLARSFEAQFPGLSVRVERSGSERVFQRIAQEMASGIHAVDVVNSADAAHLIAWNRNQWLAAYLPEEVARHYPAAYYDPDGLWVTSRIWFSSLGYNTK